MGSFLVIGMGRFGSSVAAELYRMKHEVLVLDEHEDDAADMINQVTNVIIGDAKDESVLRSLGVPNFDCVVVGIAGHLEDSILATMILKDLGAKMIVCKAVDERHARILTMLGADRVIRPEYDMGKRVARSLTQKNVIDFLEISPDYGIMEIVTPKEWVGKTIVKNNLRRKYGITVIAIRNGETEKVKFSPNPDTVLYRDDVLTILGLKDDLESAGMMK